MIVTSFVLFPYYKKNTYIFYLPHIEGLTWGIEGRKEYIWRMNFLSSEIWDALRAATEAELILAQAIIDSAGVIVQNDDLTLCYDERGTKLIA